MTFAVWAVTQSGCGRTKDGETGLSDAGGRDAAADADAGPERMDARDSAGASDGPDAPDATDASDAPAAGDASDGPGTADATDSASAVDGSDAPGAMDASGGDGPQLSPACGTLTWGGANFAAMAPDGSSFALGNDTRVEVRTWPDATLLPVALGTLGATSVVYSGDGSRLFIGKMTGNAFSVDVWSLSTNQLVDHITDLLGGPIAVSRDGSVVATATPVPVVRRATGQVTISSALISSGLALSPDGSALVVAQMSTRSSSGTYSYSVTAWNTTSGAVLWTVPNFNGLMPQTTRVVFSPDGTTIALGAMDVAANVPPALLRASDGMRTLIPTANSQPFMFSADGTGLVGVVNTTPRAIDIWRTSDGVAVRSFSLPAAALTGGFGPSLATEAVLVPRVLSTNGPGTIQLVADGTALPTSIAAVGSAGVGSVAVSASGKVLVGIADGSTHAWDLSTGMMVQSWQGQGPLAVSPDGTQVATTFNGAVSLAGPPGTPTGVSASAVVAAVAFSPDGMLLATANTDHTGQIWSARTGALLATLGQNPITGHTGPLTAVAFSADSATVVTASTDNTMKLWQASDGSLIRTQALGAIGGATSLAITPDGSHVFAGGGGTDLLGVLDLGAGTFQTVVSTGSTESLVLSPAGDELWVPGADQILRLRVVDLTALTPLAIPGGTWSALARSGDGSIIVTVSGVIRISCFP